MSPLSGQIADAKLFDYASIVPALMPPNADFEQNVRNNWPLILQAMNALNVGGTLSFIGALATVRVETGHFTPIAELGKRSDFIKYDGRLDLGNTQKGDGYKFRGRGFIQLTGRANYEKMTSTLNDDEAAKRHFESIYPDSLGADLIQYPDEALDPGTAALIFAFYWRDHHGRHIQGNKIIEGTTLKQACEARDWKKVRELVNGGLNGFTLFQICVHNLLRICCTCDQNGADANCVIAEHAAKVHPAGANVKDCNCRNCVQAVTGGAK